MKILLYRVILFYLLVLMAGAIFGYAFWKIAMLHAYSIPFWKAIAHATVASSLIGIFFLVRLLKVNRRYIFGFGVDRCYISYSFRNFAIGIAFGILMLSLHVWILIFLGVRESDFDKAHADYIQLITIAIVNGLAVAIWEEILFRGVLFGAFLRHARVWQAAFLSALIYAALHFTRSRLEIIEPMWWSGLLLQWDALTHVIAWRNLDSFLALFSAGVVLAFLRVWTGSLWAPIGMHAGWVMVIYLSRKVTDDVPQAEWAWLTGSFDQIIGWLGLLGMSLMALKLAWLIRARMNQRIFDSL